jgi:hypothetical protein
MKVKRFISIEKLNTKMRSLKVLMIVIIVFLFLIGCKAEQKLNKVKNRNLIDFKNKKYAFSFSFPADWDEVTKDLPDRWAIMNKNKDTILFTVNKAQFKNLLTLGKIQALRDLYPGNANKIEQEKVDEINKMVKLATFNDKTWYTYAIKFSDKKVDSIISGTLCGENEINFVLVSSFNSFEKNKIIYSDMLNSFKC